MRDFDMVAAARRVLLANGFEPEPPHDIERTIPGAPDRAAVAGCRDLRDLLWSSIDNRESRDLDQLEVAERLPENKDAIILRVAIADCDAFVPRGSPVDRFAFANTTSLYTGVRVFPMLPDVLSEGRTSLLEGEDRYAIVTEMVVHLDGSVDDRRTAIYPAIVRNHAKMVYEDVGGWLAGERDWRPRDERIEQQLALQREATDALRGCRDQRGALDFETIEARPVTQEGRIVDLQVIHKNRARELIEDIMIAANGATARYLESRQRSSIRRVVREPKNWPRIRELAASFGHELPTAPNVRALSDFLTRRRVADPARFGDLSLSVVKLLGPGEYVLQRASEPDQIHFGLAVDDYTHSTAPNRRYPDLVTQRLLKSCIAGAPPAYGDDELVEVARHCTERENAARKVERTMRKIAAAVLLSPRIGETFDAIVTGATDKGTFARLIRPPAEGRIVTGEHGLAVGDRVQVRLLDTDPDRGFIDFAALR